MRKMASIRSIDNIEPITDADSIEVLALRPDLLVGGKLL